MVTELEPSDIYVDSQQKRGEKMDSIDIFTFLLRGAGSVPQGVPSTADTLRYMNRRFTSCTHIVIYYLITIHPTGGAHSDVPGLLDLFSSILGGSFRYF